MPGLSGFEVCTRVRALWPESRLPIILLSANTEEQSVSTGLKLGCNDYVRCVSEVPLRSLVRARALSLGLERGCLLWLQNDLLSPPPCCLSPSLRKPVKSEELAARVSTQLRLKDVWKLESDAHMLRTMLPEEIIHRLGQGETDIADAHNNITVLFSGAPRALCTHNSLPE